MAVKIALAVGLFIVICVPPGLKASQVVPDGLVYTEVKKTLVQGVQGLLTYRFNGDPLAVYWRKGLDPDDLSLMVSWLNGEVSGPRYDDGSCDVDENYSLIIKNVSTTDAGRIHCKVVNYKGNSMKNYTDILVVDTAITTNPQATLQMRLAIYYILQCTVHIRARRVSWTKGTTSSANVSLVVIDNNQDVAARSGDGYYNGTYNITQEYSLVIKELQIHHEGLYVCEVTDDTGMSFRNYTFVNVVAQPLEPFPTIQECLNAEQLDLHYCILVAKSKNTLTCQAEKYYPSINLVFVYGSKVLEPSYTSEWNNTDGTKNKTISIATRDNKDLYTYICVASNTPGTNGSKYTAVIFHDEKLVKSTLGMIVFAFAGLMLLSLVAYLLRRNRQQLEQELAQQHQLLEGRVNWLLMQHYRRISDLIGTKSTIPAEDIISENRTALFNTDQMLIDWRESQTSRVKEAIDVQNEPDYAWPSDEELNTISRHLARESMKKVCKKLTIDCQYDDANDERERFETLRKWRTNASDKPLEESWKQLSSVLESNNLRGLLPTLRGPYIYKAELVDLAFHLLINDLFPVAKVLGIHVPKLVSYRAIFDPSHLEIGTIKLVIELFESIESSPLPMSGEDYTRSVFCRKIANLHYIHVTITEMFEYDMSYGELCSISEAINQNPEEHADQEATSGMLQGPGISESLQNVLQLTDQDIADRLDASHPLTAFALLKIWKEKTRPSVFNYRAALAYELRRTQMPGLADEIAAGKYMTERTSLAFIDDMVQGLKQDKLHSLGNVIKLSGTDVHWPTNTPIDVISKDVYAWVAKWTSAMATWRRFNDTAGSADVVAGDPGLGPWTYGRIHKTIPHEHRDLNDRLVENGFLDLAREIMIIEQQLVAGLLT